MAVCSSTIERKTPRRMRCRVILEKKFSTALSQGAGVGGKWKGRRGWRSSRAGRVVGEGARPARMAHQPGQHLGMVVSGIVVKHGGDQLAGRDLTLDGIEKA